MEEQPGQAQSQLYLLRVWIVPGPGGAVSHRGKLQPVLGDSSYCFTIAPELYALLASLLPGTPTSPTGSHGPTTTDTDEPPAHEG